MAKPKLTRENCDDIRRMYADRTRNIGTSNLSHLFRVSQATINKVLNGHYRSLEEYEAELPKASKQEYHRWPMKLKDIGKSLHDAVYESEPEDKPSEQANPPTPAPTMAAVIPQSRTVTEASPQVDDVYHGLLSRTDPANCEHLAKLYKAAEKLEHIIPDRVQRLKAAAAAQDIDAASLGRDVQSLKAALAHEVERVHQAAEQAKSETIQSAEQAAAALRKEIEDKQHALQQTLVDIENSRTKIAAKESAFAQASQRRANELDQIEREVSAL